MLVSRYLLRETSKAQVLTHNQAKDTKQEVFSHLTVFSIEHL